MKTVQEWFDTLPREVRIRAMWNMRRDCGDYRSSLLSEERSLYAALSTSFIWRLTPEGFAYWRAVAKGEYKLTFDLVKLAIHESDTAFTNKLNDDEVEDLANAVIKKLKANGRLNN